MQVIQVTNIWMYVDTCHLESSVSASKDLPTDIFSRYLLLQMWSSEHLLGKKGFSADGSKASDCCTLSELCLHFYI